jgi:hypothetical protein
VADVIGGVEVAAWQSLKQKTLPQAHKRWPTPPHRGKRHHLTTGLQSVIAVYKRAAPSPSNSVESG